MNNKNIPSDEDFARASAALKSRSRGLSEVRDRVISRFREALHEFFILDCSEMSFRAYVFYHWKRQVDEAKVSGLASQIREAVFEELENAGRGNRSTVQIEFEFDSHESVEREFNGDYYSRLR
ncbi:MAG: hypothetical protein ABI478_10225 [Propionivibrio sp.]